MGIIKEFFLIFSELIKTLSFELISKYSIQDTDINFYFFNPLLIKVKQV